MVRPSLATAAARVARLVVVYVPPRRRGLRFATKVERWFGRPETPLRAKHVSGYVITCDLRDPVQRTLFYRGTYEPRTSTLVAHALAPGDVFLDVGANVGHFTFLAARVVGARGAVHAIEASRATADALRLDVKRNGLGTIVTVHNVGAADKAGRIPLRGGNDPSSAGTRYLDPTAGADATAEAVDVVAIDELLPAVRVAVVKVDVEGADLRALSGMRHIVESSRPRLVVVEAEDEQLSRFGDSVAELKTYMNTLGYDDETIVEEWHPRALAFRPRP